MPITLHQGSLKYKNQQGNFTDIDCIKGDDYVLTEQDKEDIAEMVDAPVSDVQVNGTSIVNNGVANVLLASSNAPGVIQTNSAYGFSMVGSLLRLSGTSEQFIKAADVDFRFSAVNKQHMSTFYGLAKAAGADMKSIANAAIGVYPEAQKSAIHEMLNGAVTISGTTPSITALAGIQYVCGECATLDITLPASGCIDVVFESGSTATVLTITPPTGVTVKWANGFDPDNLDADTTYEINIMNGLGVAAAWT